jgi:Na+-transporting methylmalonyl-CoA/oxaloacetate decarboxylase gamma subunit
MQAAVTNLGLIITNHSFSQIEKDYTLRLLLFIPSCIIFGLTTFILFKFNIKVLNFKKKNINVYYFSRVRFVVLQLSFTFLVIVFNFKLYWSNKNLFSSFSDKVLIVMNLAFVFSFTTLIVINVFKMGKNIQKEEEQKRKYDSREIFQNIDYLCKLMESKDYNEVNNILISMKSDVNSDILDK